MHRTAFPLALAALIVLACEPSPTAPDQVSTTPSFARGGEPSDGRPDHENRRDPFARTVANPCPPVPEPVAVEGYLHTNTHFKFFDGGNTSRLMWNIHASGIGLVTGVKYQYHELWTLRGTYTYADSRWETDQTTRFHVISQTGLGNFFSTVRMKIVYTPTSISTEVVSMDTDCRG